MDKVLKIFLVLGIVVVSGSFFYYLVVIPKQKQEAGLRMKNVEKNCAEEIVKKGQEVNASSADYRAAYDFCVKLRQ